MKKRILSVILSVSIILASISVLPASAFAYEEAQTLLSNVSASDWMSVIRDETKLTEITMPGTHDSCARKFHNEDPFGVTSGISKCQNLTISEQLNAGVRFLDVRCEVDASSHSVKTVHGSTDCWNGDNYYYLDFCFQDVYNFLAAHPSETVLISIKEDDGDVGVPHFTNATATVLRIIFISTEQIITTTTIGISAKAFPLWKTSAENVFFSTVLTSISALKAVTVFGLMKMNRVRK